MTRMERAFLGGIVGFISAIGALHWLQPDLNPLNEAMSYYVHGVDGWQLTFSLFSLGLGSLALTLAVRREGGSTISRGGYWCLGVWSVGAWLGAIFAAYPPGRWDRPPSVSGAIHGLAAMVALVIFPIAAILLSRSLRGSTRWAGISGVLLVLAIVSAATLVVSLSSLIPVFVRPGPPRSCSGLPKGSYSLPTSFGSPLLRWGCSGFQQRGLPSEALH